MRLRTAGEIAILASCLISWGREEKNFSETKDNGDPLSNRKFTVFPATVPEMRGDLINLGGGRGDSGDVSDRNDRGGGLPW